MSLLLTVLTTSVLTLGGLRTPALQSCQPTEHLTAGHPARDSVVVNGRPVPRTAAALKPLYPKPHNMLHAYPGERISIYVGTRHIGVAVFDGCQLVPEWPATTDMPTFDNVSEFEMYEGANVPAPYRNRAGYRVLLITKWGSHAAPPA